MATFAFIEPSRLLRLPTREDVQHPRVAAALFAALMAVQALGYLILGTGHAGQSLSGFVIVGYNVIALIYTWLVSRRAKGTAGLFWLLFLVTLVILLIPQVLGLARTLGSEPLVSDATWRALWCLYGGPIVMMLFLPDFYPHSRIKTEIFLDLFQVAVVVGLGYFAFCYLPLQRMLPAEALLRNLDISNLLSLVLLSAVSVRLLLARAPSMRELIQRLAIFVLVCALVTLMGNWIDLHHYSRAAAWFDLGWDLPLIAAAFVALTWKPGPETCAPRRPASFLSFLGTNLFLVSVLACINLLVDQWKAAYGELLADIAVAASLTAFTLRLALTQYHQRQEITQREAAQIELSEANETIRGLLEDSRRQASALTQISELGSLLQACATREEAFRLIPERMRRLFPGTSGALSTVRPSKNRLEAQVEWGACPPADQLFTPDECWALRRGCTHVCGGGESAIRCGNLCSEGSALCLPLIANGEAIGVLAIQKDQPEPGAAAHSALPSAWYDLVKAVAEHTSLALSNLNLREALRTQAVRDPLTGLYNRRYLQEFLEHELQRCRRQRRPLALLMLDIDHFKRYNDLYGHAAGDEALRAVSEVLLHSVRPDDVACRFGGEEFVILLPECPLTNAAERAAGIRERVKRVSNFSGRPGQEIVTVSVGIAAYDERAAFTAAALLKIADDALYQAKRDGRDRVVVAETPAS